MQKKDFVTGLLFTIIGSVFKIKSLDYTVGSLSFMGPGYYPDLISTALIILGVVLVLKSVTWKS